MIVLSYCHAVGGHQSEGFFGLFEVSMVEALAVQMDLGSLFNRNRMQKLEYVAALQVKEGSKYSHQSSKALETNWRSLT